MKKPFHKTIKEKKAFTPKYTPPELKPVDEVKALFRHYFANHRDAGHVMPPEAVKKYVLKKLRPKEDGIFADALKSLKKEGFIEVLEDGVSLMLTQKGSDSFKK